MPENTGLYINTDEVGWTPQGGSRSILNRITQSQVSKGGRNIAFSGDGDIFPTFRANVGQDPGVSFQGGNIGRYFAISPGAKGTVDWTIGDAGTGAHAGAIKFTLVNAVAGDGNAQVPHQNFASGGLSFESFSSDGVTNPLSYTYLSS